MYRYIFLTEIRLDDKKFICINLSKLVFWANIHVGTVLISMSGALVQEKMYLCVKLVCYFVIKIWYMYYVYVISLIRVWVQGIACCSQKYSGNWKGNLAG